MTPQDLLHAAQLAHPAAQPPRHERRHAHVRTRTCVCFCKLALVLTASFGGCSLYGSVNTRSYDLVSPDDDVLQAIGNGASAEATDGAASTAYVRLQ